MNDAYSYNYINGNHTSLLIFCRNQCHYKSEHHSITVQACKQNSTTVKI